MKAQANTKLSKPLKIFFVTGLTLLTLMFVLPFIFLIIYIFFFRPFQVSGAAMSPNYTNGQYFLSKIKHGDGDLKRGEVIVFRAPDNPEKDYFKRVIAISGDKIMFKNGDVYLNDQPLDESKYLDSSVETTAGSFIKENLAVTVPEGYYFVMGDNRPNSNDSREFGFVPQKNIIGKFLFCYWNCKSNN